MGGILGACASPYDQSSPPDRFDHPIENRIAPAVINDGPMRRARQSRIGAGSTICCSMAHAPMQNSTGETSSSLHRKTGGILMAFAQRVASGSGTNSFGRHDA